MQTIRSKDGTAIAIHQGGKGEPLVLVHGGASLGARWTPLLPLLEPHCTVYVVDRRGRGGSGEGAGYAIEREFEDIAAVVESIGEPANLLGHSYGGLCALEAVRLTGNVRTLIAYEPPLLAEGSRGAAQDLLVEFRSLLEADRREDVYMLFITRLVGMPAEDVEVQRSRPDLWNARIAIVHTIVRELEAAVAYQFNAERFGSLTTPALFMLGSESPQWLKASTERFHAAMPHSRIAILPGQRHIAMDTAPELFVREVLDFVKAAR